MKKEIPKKYVIQGKGFEFEKPCFAFSQACDELSDKIDKLFNANENYAGSKRYFDMMRARITGRLTAAQLKEVQGGNLKSMDAFPEDKEEFAFAMQKYTTLEMVMRRKFLKNMVNVKELFATCFVDYDESKINFEVKGKGYEDLLKVAAEVLKDFFLQEKNSVI